MRINKRITTPEDVTSAEQPAASFTDVRETLRKKDTEDSTQSQETNLTAIPFPAFEKAKAHNYIALQDKNISSLDQYIEVLRNSIVKVKPTKCALAIELRYFYDFHKPENYKLFGMLLKSKIDFYFFDPKNPEIKEYDNNAIEVIYNYFLDTKDKRSSSNQQKDKNEIRNPNLLTPDYIDFASRKRTQKSYFDPNNIKTWLEIYKFKIAGFNDNKIAKALNNNGWLSARGSVFTAKQIGRLVESHKKLMDSFKPHPMEAEYLQVENHRNLPALPISSISCNHEFNLVCIQFKQKIDDEVYVQIEDNQEENRFRGRLTASNMDIKIDILKDTTMYPGRNYIILTSLSYCDYRAPVDVHPELLPKAYLDAGTSAESN